MMSRVSDSSPAFLKIKAFCTRYQPAMEKKTQHTPYLIRSVKRFKGLGYLSTRMLTAICPLLNWVYPRAKAATMALAKAVSSKEPGMGPMNLRMKMFAQVSVIIPIRKRPPIKVSILLRNLLIFIKEFMGALVISCQLSVFSRKDRQEIFLIFQLRLPF